MTSHDPSDPGVCRACNSGWMSQLESTASRVLTPFILGVAGGGRGGHDLAVIAAWMQEDVPDSDVRLDR
jgi:hypothetical protein